MPENPKKLPHSTASRITENTEISGRRIDVPSHSTASRITENTEINTTKKSPYQDIINLPHFHAPNKPYMKNADRAAQFAPFKSLTVDGLYNIDEAKNDDKDYQIIWTDE